MTDQFLANYATIVLASYLDSHDRAHELQEALDAFIADPDQTKFDDAKEIPLGALLAAFRPSPANLGGLFFCRSS